VYPVGAAAPIQVRAATRPMATTTALASQGVRWLTTQRATVVTTPVEAAGSCWVWAALTRASRVRHQPAAATRAAARLPSGPNDQCPVPPKPIAWTIVPTV